MQEKIVILTGAGISAESGINTFRDAGGLWENHRIEDVATPEAFQRDPHGVQAFYNRRREQLRDPAIRPNAAHQALARLERERPGEVLVITQNVDNLHERAGSRNVIHMHGELLKARCQSTDTLVPVEADLAADLECQVCGAAGCLRPHVVWFGEMPLEMDRIFDALAGCERFISIGTSGNVYPAAGFVAEARAHGAHTVELNLEPSEQATAFAEHRHGPASERVPDYVEELLAGG
ncbi:Sir2 family NAD+-dependent deacetylase [Alloalcanivorax profundimaris]|uniref:NAD-dependent protein deacylase n=1 Tax=Alloalcanivorax profundimaris TaxID=2735259 RepID=A0ABS0ATN1_9GAMM|nr:Sir2 family NAD+-dependent deacetylase [Alloalcanivorax profundimaris]MAO60606.1 NAD-dependent protein deacylase [Alcanivorax sp.]MBM1144029.1 NAD-dependent protein deacylase [Alcanivorax sp. ZXX171]UWN48123.1 NAD-dependent protein deacylase [Alcanivorax sp. ALC70]MBF1800543.1 NAD-dependent protein deacylase [Alloalcanivorax profundimaris]MBF5057496.1 NAD-dependent deacetylase [Alloalcanivorax profundimaris]|tara:strand:- start:38938 stop:39645 length:708 start_codon:yes stop_codon:yes gene_type:complete